MNKSDFNLRTVFQSLPVSYLVLNPDLVILAATDDYYELTLTKPEELIGTAIFDAFPESGWTTRANSTQNNRTSFEHVLRHKTPNTIPVQRYDIKLPPSEGGKFVRRWWRITNSPILNAGGELTYIVHAVEDITKMIDTLAAAEVAIKRKRTIP